MFGLGKKKLSESGLFQGMTDRHCHILPGVDDGVESMEDSLKILKKYEALGVSCVWLTPHIMEDMPNETAELQQRFAELKAAYNGPISLHLAAEYMIDNLFNERFDAKDLLYHGNPEVKVQGSFSATATKAAEPSAKFKVQGSESVSVSEASAEGSSLTSNPSPLTFLLVETSYFTPPMDLYGTLEKIKRAGIFPILAHPERYVYMDDKDYDRLRQMGVRLQLNLFSLTNQYGDPVRKKAEHLLSKGYYSLLGTDLHRHAQLLRQIEQKLSKKAYASLAQIAR